MSRYAFLARPRFVLFTLGIAGLVVLMVNLAFWQLRRLHERRDANAQVTEHVAEGAVPIGALLTPTSTGADVHNAQWRSVSATGTYDPTDQVLIRNRSLDSNDGYHVVTPLRLADGTGVLVNRGWIPLEEQAGKLPAIPPAPPGIVTVTGRVRASQQKGRYFSPTDPPTGRLLQLYRVDVPRIGRQVPFRLLPAYLELQSTQPAPASNQPVLVALPELDDGPHLSYAVQWFFFSGCAIAGWILAIRRSAKQRQEAIPPTDVADEPTTSSPPPSPAVVTPSSAETPDGARSG